MNLFHKLRDGLKKTTDAVTDKFETIITSFHKLDEEFIDELMEIMILADMGMETAGNVCDKLRARAKREQVETPQEMKQILKDILVQEVSPLEKTQETYPLVILVIGVNGVGKTTTIGKLAHKYKTEGKSVLLSAGDTFRAAAAEQLSIWAQRADCDIIKHKEGADPSAVIFDTLTSAKARGTDVVICDTAGRLHNKQNLMNELAKISRVIDREMPGAMRENLLVLDATTGQNATHQAAEFGKVTDITGVVLTKLDGTAKGGIAVAVSAKAPIKFIGIGEKIDDLIDFEPIDFVEALIGE